MRIKHPNDAVYPAASGEPGIARIIGQTHCSRHGHIDTESHRLTWNAILVAPWIEDAAVQGKLERYFPGCCLETLSHVLVMFRRGTVSR